MQILEVTSTIYTFKPVPCNECDFRFGCWTAYSTCCPLKAVRLVVYDDQRFASYFGKRRISINENLGRFDHLLLTKIGEALDKAYETQQKS